MPLDAELVLRNGTVRTLDDPPRAQALAVRAGKVVAVGREDEIVPLVGEATRVVDLAGRTLLPGFVDAHTHLVRTGMEHTLFLSLGDVRSRDELFQRVEAAVKEREPGRWVVGRGWDESAWSDPRCPIRVELDRLAPRHPVALIRVCGHLLVANAKALAAVPVADDPATVDLERGWLREEAAWAFLEAIEPALEERVAALAAGIERAHACGITTIHEVADRAEIEAYTRLQRRGALKLRVRLNVRPPLMDHLIGAGLGGEFGDDRLRIGALKLFADGSLGARNAALFEPYADDRRTRGKLNHEVRALVAWMRRGHEHGFQLMTHAIGDRAIEAVLAAYEAVGVTPADRARIEHLELPRQEHLERMARRGVIASMQPNFLQWSGPDKLYARRLGPEREARIDPHRRVLEWGVSLAFGSDGMPLGPLYGIQLAVNAPHPVQRVSVEEALRAYTLGGAHAGRAEERLGSLRPGKWADLIVLDRDPFEHPDALNALRVEEVYLAGERVWEAPSGAKGFPG